MRPVVLALLAACGRLNFEPVERIDDAAPDSAPVVPSLVAMQSAMATPADNVTIVVEPTTPGSLLIVATVSFNIPGTAETVQGITSNGDDTFASVGQLAPWNGGEGATEIWYAADSRGGATEVKITSTGVTTRELWYLEFTGLDVVPLQTAASISDHPADALPGAPVVTPERTPAVIVSIMQISGFISAIAPGNPFMALPAVNGDDAAYLIATEPGTYGAKWDGAGTDNYSAITAAFLAPP